MSKNSEKKRDSKQKRGKRRRFWLPWIVRTQLRMKTRRMKMRMRKRTRIVMRTLNRRVMDSATPS